MSKAPMSILVAALFGASCAAEAPGTGASASRKLDLPALDGAGPRDYAERAQEQRILALLTPEYAENRRFAEASTQATITFADLNDDGRKEALPYVEGWGPGGVCGTSGCNLHVYTPEGSGYRQVASLIGYPPIRILGSRTRGWRDLAMWVQGGGHVHGFEAAVAFDGTKYEGFNLANPPAWRVPSGEAGDTLIPRKLTVTAAPGAQAGPRPPPFGPDRR